MSLPRILFLSNKTPGNKDLPDMLRRIRPRYSVTVAHTELEAQELKPQHTDILLCDISEHTPWSLPFLRTLMRQENPPVIIFLAPQRDFHLLLAALRLGGVDFLYPPFFSKQLEESIQRAEDRLTRETRHTRAQAELERKIASLPTYMESCLNRIVHGEIMADHEEIYDLMPAKNPGLVILFSYVGGASTQDFDRLLLKKQLSPFGHLFSFPLFEENALVVLLFLHEGNHRLTSPVHPVLEADPHHDLGFPNAPVYFAANRTPSSVHYVLDAEPHHDLETPLSASPTSMIPAEPVVLSVSAENAPLQTEAPHKQTAATTKNAERRDGTEANPDHAGDLHLKPLDKLSPTVIDGLYDEFSPAVPTDISTEDEEERMAVLGLSLYPALSEALVPYLNNYYNPVGPAFAAIGRIREDLRAQVAEAFEDAKLVRALRFYIEAPVLTPLHARKEISTVVPPAYCEAYWKAVSQLKLKEAESAAAQIFLETIKDGLPQPVLLHLEFERLQLHALDALRQTFGEAHYLRCVTQFQNELRSSITYVHLQEAFLQQLRHMITYATQLRKSKGNAVISRCLEYMREHYAEPLSAELFASHYHFNYSYFCNLFRRNTGLPFSQYLMNLRLENAKTMLTETTLRIFEVAARCGFRDATYFSRIFKRETQYTPDEYRKLYAKV